jgi:hypothetical protein
MKGLMYIAGSFETVDSGKCGRGRGWIDNDPHFWKNPPTWGICRNDLRRKAEEGDYIFFVLPKNAKHPQSIFGYLRVAKIISHMAAYWHADLRSKRMANKNPNGNIIVDHLGNYNRFDGGVHRGIFEKVKQRYVIGDAACSRFLTDFEIKRAAPGFVKALSVILGKRGKTPIELISRYGCELSASQVEQIVAWLKSVGVGANSRQ